jgi:hypothetical protein
MKIKLIYEVTIIVLKGAVIIAVTLVIVACLVLTVIA